MSQKSLLHLYCRISISFNKKIHLHIAVNTEQVHMKSLLYYSESEYSHMDGICSNITWFQSQNCTWTDHQFLADRNPLIDHWFVCSSGGSLTSWSWHLESGWRTVVSPSGGESTLRPSHSPPLCLTSSLPPGILLDQPPPGNWSLCCHRGWSLQVCQTDSAFLNHPLGNI